MSGTGGTEEMGGTGATDGLRLVLVRHGQTPANVARILDTRLPGPGLTDLGRAQAEALGGELAGGDGGPPVVAVYHSPARRTAETAALVATRLGLVPRRVEGVHEVQVGDLEGRNDDDALAVFRDVFDGWLAGDLDRPHPGGESGRDVLDRFLPAVDRLRAAHRPGETIVLVSHGAALRLVAQTLVAGVGTPEAGADHLGNCGRVTMRSASDAAAAWRLETWRGDVPGDLPASHDATG